MTPKRELEASKRASITIIKRLLLRESGTIVHLRAAIKLTPATGPKGWER